MSIYIIDKEQQDLYVSGRNINENLWIMQVQLEFKIWFHYG